MFEIDANGRFVQLGLSTGLRPADLLWTRRRVANDDILVAILYHDYFGYEEVFEIFGSWL